MAVRATMSNLIARVRILINDPESTTQVFTDQTIQDVLDASRVDSYNQIMTPQPTFTGSTIQYLDYFTNLTDWEDDLVLKQFLVNVVTPATSEVIAGHFHFTATTLPPVYITGKLYDIYRCAADLLERQAAQWVLRYDFSGDGQSFHRSQAVTMLTNLAKTYRAQQRAHSLSLMRTDLAKPEGLITASLGPQPIDYF
jgi:hypothetical protein